MTEQSMPPMTTPPLKERPEWMAVNNDIIRSMFYADLFTKEECQQILAAPIDTAGGEHLRALQKKYMPGFESYMPKDLGLIANIEENLWLPKHLQAMLSILNDRHYHFEVAGLSDIQLLTLQTGEHLDWHTSIGLGPFARHKVCCMVFLNDQSEYEGGSVQSMSGFGPEHRTQGSLIIYPSIATLRIHPVKQGEMKILRVALTGQHPFY